MKFINKKLSFALSLLLTIIVTVIFFLQSKNDFFPDSAIQSKAEEYAKSFVSTARDVEGSLLEIQSIIDTVDFFQLNNERKMKLLIDKLNESPKTFGFMIIDHTGRLTALFRDNSTFAFASDSASKIDNLVWYRVNSKYEVLNQWSTALGYEIDLLHSNSEVVEESQSLNSPLWSSARDLLGNANNKMVNYVSWHSQITGNLTSCVVIVDEESFIERVPLLYSDEFHSILLDDNGKLLALENDDLCDTIDDENDACSHILKSWEVTGRHIPGTFNFSFQNQQWWGQALPIDINGISVFILSIDTQGLYYSSVTDHRMILTFILLLTIITIVLFFYSFRKAHVSLEDFIRGKENDQHASELIKLGETSHLEFKSSFRFDLVQQTVNKDLESVIAKSIAAFSNAEGGTLLIGVDDNGKVLGLENDINTLKRKDIDFFENTLRAFLNKTFKVAFVTQNIKMKFPVIDEKAICRIDVKKGSEPVFVEINKKGSKSERFYVRSGNTSQEMTSLSEINSYINTRFSEE